MYSSTKKHNVVLQQQPKPILQQSSYVWEHSSKTYLIKGDFHLEAQGSAKGMLPGSQ